MIESTSFCFLCWTGHPAIRPRNAQNMKKLEYSQNVRLWVSVVGGCGRAKLHTALPESSGMNSEIKPVRASWEKIEDRQKSLPRSLFGPKDQQKWLSTKCRRSNRSYPCMDPWFLDCPHPMHLMHLILAWAYFAGLKIWLIELRLIHFSKPHSAVDVFIAFTNPLSVAEGVQVY